MGIDGQQVHLDLRHHVAAHRHPVRVGEGGDLPPRRHAADPGEVEDEHVDGARVQQRAEGVEVIEVLAGGERHLAAAVAGRPARRGRGGGSDPPATRCRPPAGRGRRGAPARASSVSLMSTMIRGVRARRPRAPRGRGAPPPPASPPDPAVASPRGSRRRRGAGRRRPARPATGCTRGRRSRTSGRRSRWPPSRRCSGWPSVLPPASHTAMSSGASAQCSRPPGPAQSPRRASRSQAASGSSTLMPIRCSPSSRAACPIGGHQIRARVDDVADALDAVGGPDAGQDVPVRVDCAPARQVRALDGDPHHVHGHLRDLHHRTSGEGNRVRRHCTAGRPAARRPGKLTPPPRPAQYRRNVAGADADFPPHAARHRRCRRRPPGASRRGPASRRAARRSTTPAVSTPRPSRATGGRRASPAMPGSTALRAELKAAAAEGRPVSVGAARHSMGGQALARDGVAMTFDVKAARRRLDRPRPGGEELPRGRRRALAPGDRARSTRRLLAGRHAVEPRLRRRRHAVGQRPRLAGAVRAVRRRPSRSCRLMLAAGELVTCSPSENAELFGLVMGGYGLLGVDRRSGGRRWPATSCSGRPTS